MVRLTWPMPSKANSRRGIIMRESKIQNPKSKILKLGGRAINLKPVPKLMARLIAWLDDSKEDELYTNQQIMDAVGVASQTLNCYAIRPELARYKEKIS